MSRRSEVREHTKEGDKHRSKVYLIRESVSVWRQEDRALSPSQLVLTLPFEFPIPITLPPSCHYKTAQKAKGSIVYWIKAVGVRPGLRWNKRITQTITLLPCNFRGAELSRLLEPGWRGDWAFQQFTKDVRRGVYGEHSHVTMTVSGPFLASISQSSKDFSSHCRRLRHIPHSRQYPSHSLRLLLRRGCRTTRKTSKNASFRRHQ